jgi:hypothetical protein
MPTPNLNVDVHQLAAQAVALRDLLADEERWTFGKLAVTKYGVSVEPTDPRACKFCLIGGIGHVIGSTNAYDEVPTHPLGLLIANVIHGVEGNPSLKVVTDWSFYNFNDNRKHHEVMEVLHTAVAVAKGAAEAGVEV